MLKKTVLCNLLTSQARNLIAMMKLGLPILLEGWNATFNLHQMDGGHLALLNDGSMH